MTNSKPVGDKAPGKLAELWKRARNWVVAVGSLIVVVLIVLVLNWVSFLDVTSWWRDTGRWWADAGWPWLSKWMLSPGFGGAAAVLAASLAFIGTRHQARLNAWWQRVEWALNLYVKRDATDSERQAGVAALEALEKSALAKRDEKAFLAEVVTAVSLDLDDDGDETDDLVAEQPRVVSTGPSFRTRQGAFWTKLRSLRDNILRRRTGGAA
ncbi:hypothetical protein [Microbacterium sp. p3-SID336]|uniref:hypothetical protein n=1 Tax=Microbacterium sp. p3-SID336 TaxID=2916212 RepID=UPI0021A5E7EB|nr:hypothetical protein [Microbacterium sp. p3-SID336]MCT1479372.1 hypothetical protein [Microbacterium sp. p3-SID336]